MQGRSFLKTVREVVKELLCRIQPRASVYHKVRDDTLEDTGSATFATYPAFATSASSTCPATSATPTDALRGTPQSSATSATSTSPVTSATSTDAVWGTPQSSSRRESFQQYDSIDHPSIDPSSDYNARRSRRTEEWVNNMGVFCDPQEAGPFWPIEERRQIHLMHPDSENDSVTPTEENEDESTVQEGYLTEQRMGPTANEDNR
jgi:hypothetical protein